MHSLPSHSDVTGTPQLQKSRCGLFLGLGWDLYSKDYSILGSIFCAIWDGFTRFQRKGCSRGHHSERADPQKFCGLRVSQKGGRGVM